jgi:hypothetical protein
MQTRRIFTLLEDVSARRKGLRIWFVLVLTWSIIRSLLVARVFQRYGLNPKIYFAIDFLSSIPYAYASAQSLLKFLDKKRMRAIWWGLLTISMFYAPDIYIVYISKKVPLSTYAGFVIILIALSIFAYVQWRDSRKFESEK